MGSIIGSRRKSPKDNTVIVEVLLNQDEFRQLKGELNDVYLFSERVAATPSRVSLRGRNEATKYFLIPRQLRKRLAVFGSVSCQRIDAGEKSIFVYVVDPTKHERRGFVASS